MTDPGLGLLYVLIAIRTNRGEHLDNRPTSSKIASSGKRLGPIQLPIPEELLRFLREGGEVLVELVKAWTFITRRRGRCVDGYPARRCDDPGRARVEEVDSLGGQCSLAADALVVGERLTEGAMENTLFVNRGEESVSVLLLPLPLPLHLPLLSLLWLLLCMNPLALCTVRIMIERRRSLVSKTR